MAKPKGAGVTDKLTLKVTHAPVVRITKIPQSVLKRLILKQIKALPEMKSFKILAEPKEDGIQFITSISGKGAKSRGRQPELMIVHFEIKNPKKSKLIVSGELWDKVEALRIAILLSPQLKFLNLKVYDRTYWSGYDLEDDLPPRRFALTVEFYPPEQEELEKKMAALGRQYRENAIRDTLRKVLKTSKED